MPDAVILGVNGIGLEPSNAIITEGRDIAWLQDTPETEVWAEWGIAYRDVVVLDEEGAVAGIFNLTNADLGQPDNYDLLRSLVAP